MVGFQNFGEIFHVDPDFRPQKTKKSQKSQEKFVFYKAKVSLFYFFVLVKSLLCIRQGQIDTFQKVFGLNNATSY